MELVIKIDKETLQDLYDSRYVSPHIKDVFRSAITLPKGHGRLIDAREYENSVRKHYFDNSTVIRCTEIALDNAQTIISADEESD